MCCLLCICTFRNKFSVSSYMHNLQYFVVRWGKNIKQTFLAIFSYSNAMYVLWSQLLLVRMSMMVCSSTPDHTTDKTVVFNSFQEIVFPGITRKTQRETEFIESVDTVLEVQSSSSSSSSSITLCISSIDHHHHHHHHHHQHKYSVPVYEYVPVSDVWDV